MKCRKFIFHSSIRVSIPRSAVPLRRMVKGAGEEREHGGEKVSNINYRSEWMMYFEV